MTIKTLNETDVIVAGAGNAAACAALAAREAGASVVMLEAAPREEAGGNTTYTAGAMRFAFSGVDDIRSLLPDLGAEEIANSDFGSYTEDQFFDDMFRVTQYRTDPELVEILGRQEPAHSPVDEAAGYPLPDQPRQAGLQDRRQVQVLGRSSPEVWGGRAPAWSRWSTPPRNARASPSSSTPRPSNSSATATPFAGSRSSTRATPADARAGRGARLRRLRIQLGDAGPLSRSRLGSGEGPRHTLQHGPRPYDGDGRGRHAPWPLVRRPCGRMGPQRARLWRSGRRRRVPETQLSVRRDGERAWRALRRRGGRFPQLHIRQIWPGDPCAAGSVRLAGVRFPDLAPAAGRIPDPPDHQGHGRHDRGSGREARRRRCARLPAHYPRIQRRGRSQRAFQSQHQGRPRRPRPQRSEVASATRSRRVRSRPTP